MYKISYPQNESDLLSFEERYYKGLNVGRNIENKINNYLKNIDYNNDKLNFKTLVTLKFGDILLLSEELSYYASKQTKVRIEKGENGKDVNVSYNIFEDLFKYEDRQPQIADFFMNNGYSNLKTCHYCGLDYINAFNFLGDYYDALDFVNRAPAEDLKIIKGITDVIANKIIVGRGGGYKLVSDTGCEEEICEKIEQVNGRNTHNHFTLDHVLPQGKYKFYSLCLYNLVPSCYSCNSKFKNRIEFELDDGDLNEISPTSESYQLSDFFEFNLLYSGDISQIQSSNLNNLDTVDDLILTKRIKNNDQKKHIDKYFTMFKLGGRYTYHKDLALQLIKQKAKYSDSRIAELGRQTGISEVELRKMIFGAELYDEDKLHFPMTKFKRDIAKHIGIK